MKDVPHLFVGLNVEIEGISAKVPEPAR